MSIFTKVKQKIPKRSNFDLSHEVKLSTEFGRLTPILCQEVLPSDRWIGKTEIFCRMAPMLAPIMHRVNVYTHFFFVPNRILWDKWEEFITGTPATVDSSGTVATYHIPPTITCSTSMPFRDLYLSPGKLPDYLGIPIYDTNIFKGSGKSITFNALPFRAYQMIYNEYYRDENLGFEVPINVDRSGNYSVSDVDTQELLKIRHRAWEKDYFTSALPWPQKGQAAEIPTLQEGSLTTDPDQTGFSVAYADDGQPVDPTEVTNLQVDTHGNLMVGNRRVKIVTDPQTVNIQGINNTTINDLRAAMRLQEFLEKDARGGTRLTEILRSHFGVVSDDARLQRPQYLGGGRSNVVISEVLQQSQTTTNSNLGEMGGHGISAGITHKFRHTFKEHGWLIGILSIMPRTSYQQGLHKQFTRQTRYDYAWPEFAHLGEQAIQNQELFYDYDAGPSKNQGDFGYAPRFAEYKFINSSVHGDMCTNLDFWHLGRKFSKAPALNQDFITCDAFPEHDGDTPTPLGLNRIFATSDMQTDHFWIQIYNKITAKRPLPYYGTPLL